MRAPSSRTPLDLRTASAKRAAQTSSQINSAADEFGSSAAAAYSMSAGTDQTSDVAVQPTESCRGVQLVDLKGDDRTIDILADEDQVENPDRPGLDQIHQLWGDLSVELVPREPNDDVFDWSYGHVICPVLACSFRLRLTVAKILTLIG